jgi:S-adenosylmethionine uptake transporter
MNRQLPILPFLATLAGVALYSLMDALMKGSSLAIGVYSALLWRSVVAFAVVAPAWRLTGGRWPKPSTARLHLLRGVVSAGMALSFFYGLTLLPMAEAIAISFFAPLIALYLAAVLLGERIRRGAVLASLMGLAGVAVIAAARMGASEAGDDAAIGIAAVLGSAVLYAWNLVLQRQQAQLALPLEVASFQNGIVALVLLPLAPLLAVAPGTIGVAGAIAGAALLVLGAGMLFSWAYARAEAQALVPLEYSAFPFAALFGWLVFDEVLTWPTVAGTLLVVTACWIAVPRKRPEQTSV